MAIQTWADERLADLRETYAACWEIWYVMRSPKLGYTWHARPVGAPAATVNAGSPEDLTDKLGTLMCQCPRHAEVPRCAR